MKHTTPVHFAFAAAGLFTFSCEAGPQVIEAQGLAPQADYAFVEHGAPATSKVDPDLTQTSNSAFLPVGDLQDACVVRCRAEALATARDCLTDGTPCLADAADVFDVCGAAECSANKVDRLHEVVPPVRVAALKVPQTIAGETVVSAPPCHAACQAHDLDVYLACVREQPDDADACRANLGRAYDVCVAGHCAAE